MSWRESNYVGCNALWWLLKSSAIYKTFFCIFYLYWPNFKTKTYFRTGSAYFMTFEKTYLFFLHLSDAFIQSDLHCIQVTVSTFYQLLLSLGIEPMILALLAPCSTSWATGKLFFIKIKCAVKNTPSRSFINISGAGCFGSRPRFSLAPSCHFGVRDWPTPRSVCVNLPTAEVKAS